MKKYIHYCWFGGKPLPKLANKCIESWKKFLPDFEIIRWDESNVDLNECPFIKEAYDNKLKSKLFGLLCEREKGRDWEKFLDSILIELMGYSEEEKTINYYTLYHKLSTLKYLRYEYFRGVIFDCMDLISK